MRNRSPWLALVVALVGAACFAAALHAGTDLRLHCARADLHVTVCDVVSRRGIGPFAEVETSQVRLTDEMHLERHVFSTRHGTMEDLRSVDAEGRDRGVLLTHDGSLEEMQRALEAHAASPSSTSLVARAGGHVGAGFLSALGFAFLAVAAVMAVGFRSAAPPRGPSVTRPPLFEGRSALDVAAFLCAHPSDSAWVDEVERRMAPLASKLVGADEETRFLAANAERKCACRRYLRALFPQASPHALDDAWARAVRLDEATTRLARKKMECPGSEQDEIPDLRATCPGFSADVYGYVHNRAMTDLR